MHWTGSVQCEHNFRAESQTSQNPRDRDGDIERIERRRERSNEVRVALERTAKRFALGNSMKAFAIASIQVKGMDFKYVKC